MGKKFRVLHIIPNFRLGGAERMAVHLMSGLDRSRFVVAAVSLFDRQGTELESALERSGVKVWYLGKKKGFDPRMYSRLDAVIREFAPDVVHTHLYVLRYVVPLLFLRRLRAVHTVHSLAEREVDWRGRWVHRLTFGRRVIPVAIAQAVKASLQRVYGLHDVPVIPNGIPVSDYALPITVRQRVRLRERVPPNVPVLVSVGSLSRPKNHSLLLSAFALVPARGSQAQLWLVGEGELRAALEDQVRRLGLEARVRFWGRRGDVPEILAAADVFVLSSSWEGNPLAVMEAMAAGKPVVATAVGGVPELVEDGKTGILVPLGDAKALADALIRVVADPGLRERMGRAARLKAEEHFDVTAMVGKYEELYYGLVVAKH